MNSRKKEELCFTFKPLEISDFPLLWHFLNQEFVKEWYGGEIYEEEVKRKYQAYLSKEKKVDGYFIYMDQQAIGYIQTYFWIDDPEYNQYVMAPSNTVGVDFFIGEESYLHKGYGHLILARFLKDVIFSSSKVEECLLGTDAKNQIAIKAYQKVGFHFLKTVFIPASGETEYLMSLKKQDFLS